MMATYVQKGEVLDYTPDEAVKYGSVVKFGNRIGIAGGNIAAGEQGHIHVTGVFKMAKVSGIAISMGEAVYYQQEQDAIGKESSGVLAGYAASGAKELDTTVLVKLTG